MANVSTNVAWVFFSLGLLLLVVGSLFIWFLIMFIKKKKENKEDFQLVTGKYRYFQFWQFYAFIIVIFASYLSSIIILSIIIPVLVK